MRVRPVLIVVGILVAAAGLIGTAFSVRGPSAPASPSSARAPAVRPSGPGDALERLQARVRAQPDDAPAWAALGHAYIDRGRTTGDPSWYPKAERSLDRSLEIAPTGNAAALTGRSALASARHDFADAFRWATEAARVAPNDPTVEGVLGDALVELGRYDEAFAAFQRMVDRRPDLASYARISYARELQGDVPGALAAMEEARRSARSRSDAAFANHQLGELHWNSGNAEEAIAHYRRAAAFDPDFVPPKAGLARAAAARGQYAEAERAYQAVIARLPAPQYIGELADLYTVLGRAKDARRQLELVDAQRRLLEANGVNGDLEIALVSADHGTDLAQGLEGARAEWDRRKSIHVADALAWQLFAHGRFREALDAANQALRLSTRNAAFHFHRAKIHLALGDEAAALADLTTALDINPNFSILHARTARELLSSLSRGRAAPGS